MKILLLAAALLLSHFTQAQDTLPVTITKSGDYYNLIAKSKNGQPAITIQADSVRLFNPLAIAVDGDNGIDASGYRKTFLYRPVVIHRSTGAPAQPGKGIHIYRPRKLVIDHWEITGMNGIIIDQEDEYLADSIIIRYGLAKNITKVRPDGSVNSGEKFHVWQLNAVHGSGPVQIYGNKAVLQAGDDCEDLGNINDSWTKSGYIDIWGNLLSGGLVYPITSKDNYSGSIFTIEGNTRHVRFHHNIGLDGQNALFNISIPSNECYDNWIYNNIGVSAGIPRGAEALRPYQYWAGFSAYANNGRDSGTGNRIFSNWMGYVQWRNLAHYYPEKGRQDENNVTSNSQPNGARIPSQNIIPAGMNYTWPYTPTKGTEDSLIKRWTDSLSKAGQYAGITVPVATSSTAAKAITINQYDSLLVSAAPLDTAKQLARYTTGTFRYTSSDSSILTILPAATETAAKLVARKAGRVSVTGSLTTERGNPFSKTFDVEVLYLYPEPVDISFTFTKPGQ